MNESERLDELAERIVQTGNHFAGGNWFDLDRVREQLDSREGRDSLVSELSMNMDSFSIAMFYDDDNEAIIKGDELVDEIKAIDNDREIE